MLKSGRAEWIYWRAAAHQSGSTGGGNGGSGVEVVRAMMVWSVDERD